jgi:hypothetical protein
VATAKRVSGQRRRARISERASSSKSKPRAIDAAELAWIALLPCALASAAVIALLGPPLGHVLFPPGSDELWPRDWWEAAGQAEPVKHARYLLAAAAPLLLAAVVLAGSRRELRLPSRRVRAITYASYAAVVAVVAVSLIEQNLLFGVGEPAPTIFGPGTILAAAALVPVGIALFGRRAVTARIAKLARETSARRAVSLAIAVVFVAIWLLEAVTTDGLSGDVTGLNLPWTFNDAMAVLNGRTPLVDYRGIYAKLLPYPTALVLKTFGTTIFVYSTWMAFLAGLSLLAIYAVFRLVTRSSLLALALFVPFLATSDLRTLEISAGELSPLMFSAMWPMRYGGACLMVWLTARHIAGHRPRGVWSLFFVGGLVVINNVDFGLGAVAATLIALLCACPPRSTNAALRLGASLAGGTLGAVGAVSLLTLVRAGALPSLELLLEWPRIFTSLGLLNIPLPLRGLHLLLYATFAAAIAVAAVRLARSDADALLTSMLAWSGVFGLLAGGYFAGRPDTLKLEGMFAAWAFSLGLLAVVCVRALAVQRWRRPTLPQLLVLFAFSLSLCSITELSPPQKQIARLTETRPDPVYQATAERFVAARTQRGEKVAILVPMSYRIAYDLELRNVVPYPFMNGIVTRAQMQTLLDTLRQERIRAVFVPAPNSFLLQEGDSTPAHLRKLAAIGFRRVSSESGIVELRKG